VHGHMVLRVTCKHCECVVDPSSRAIRTSPGFKGQVNLFWEGGPRTVLLVKKKHSEDAEQARDLVKAFLESRGVKTLSEEACGDYNVDFCIALGGDGTLLHLNAQMFQREDQPVYPVLSFALGTLGFLTNFDIRDYDSILSRMLGADSSETGVAVNLRMRIRCKLLQHEGAEPMVFQALNEAVMHSSSVSIACLDLFVDGEMLTSVRADGLIISTPTGSTAYSMSAGGSMVAPSVPAILVTPICPHSLSFRPAVLPNSSEIKVVLPNSAGSSLSVSFDGRDSLRLEPGGSMEITMSEFPIPTISSSAFNQDWFHSIKHKLFWNASHINSTPVDPSIRTFLLEQHHRASL